MSRNEGDRDQVFHRFCDGARCRTNSFGPASRLARLRIGAVERHRLGFLNKPADEGTASVLIEESHASKGGELLNHD
jgi:hypothetical protein